MGDFSQSFLDPADVAARLATKAPVFTRIGTARDLGNASIETIRAPMAWVIIMSEAAGDVRYEICDVIEQLISVRFGVVLAVRDIGDRTGTVAREALRPLRERVLGALCTWQPIGSNHACRFSRGALASGIGRDGMMLWQDEFTVTFDRRFVMET
ncbi:hypothetical protein [Paracoccus sp. (in: a-proteobacteria)]|uniref:phage tail terminator protein n=1 Tax=Paracoccus sp. TaxID=267 RepID=UPI0026E0345F|nr:hypothetical protein [Paracoccus sp. (in: a-proteobacteria)]MDO5648862.1 hypothetical protein [Paracoccus sp. (in: a-proteobacteria)]